MSLKILNKKEKQNILNKLEKEFGIKEINGLLLMKGSERIYLFQGSLSSYELNNLGEEIFIERIGIYFGKKMGEGIRLSIEGVQLLKDQITKNIFDLNYEQVQDWMKGQELLIETGKKNFLVMRYKEDLVGCGKASDKKIGNYIPKNRRLKR